ncbi:hypothetical protein EDD22DRAFT_768993, partial [Suillus occidentalis]
NSTPADQVVLLILSLHEAQKLGPNLSMVKKVRTSDYIRTWLFRYLHVDLANYHMRAVSLIWSIDSMSRLRP